MDAILIEGIRVWGVAQCRLLWLGCDPVVDLLAWGVAQG